MIRFLVAILLAAAFPALFGDMGAIVPAGEVSVSEPGQKALIFHNGTEQILHLSTDIRSDRPVSIVRFIPFPSEPEVSLAPPHIFTFLEKLVRLKNLQIVIQMRGGETREAPAQITSRQKLGAHTITSIRVDSLDGFRDWFRAFAKRENLPMKQPGAAVESILADYISRGYRHIVFDRVDLTGREQTVEPVTYRFATKQLYYPLKTSNTFGGKSLIIVGVVAPTARPAYGFPEAGFSVSTTANLTDGEIGRLDPGAALFFRGVKRKVLQIYQYSGKMDFQADIVTDPLDGVPEVRAGGGLSD